jgi:hypothetical protein
MVSEAVGYDGGKKVKGRKRHLLTDGLGLLLTVVVTAANGSRQPSNGGSLWSVWSRFW